VAVRGKTAEEDDPGVAPAGEGWGSRFVSGKRTSESDENRDTDRSDGVSGDLLSEPEEADADADADADARVDADVDDEDEEEDDDEAVDDDVAVVEERVEHVTQTGPDSEKGMGKETMGRGRNRWDKT
jgi:hypothetical protein